MKRALALILALILCLGLCACGDEGQNNSTQGNEEPSGTAGESWDESALPAPLSEILRFGFTLNTLNYAKIIGCRENGTMATSAGTWELKGTTVTCNWKGSEAETYEIKDINGNYLLVGSDHTLISEFIQWDQIPQKTVTIAEDNWTEYFEVVLIEKVSQTVDPWGEVFEDITYVQLFKLKDVYFRALRAGQGSATLRYSLNGEEKDCTVAAAPCFQTGRYIFGFVLSEEEEKVNFDVLKIQGTLCLVEGL